MVAADKGGEEIQDKQVEDEEAWNRRAVKQNMLRVDGVSGELKRGLLSLNNTIKDSEFSRSNNLIAKGPCRGSQLKRNPKWVSEQ